MRFTTTLFLLGALGLWAFSSFAQPVPAELVLLEGGTANTFQSGSATITAIDYPFTNGNGNLGIGLDVDEGSGSEYAVFCSSIVVWQNSDETTFSLSGGETSMGIGNIGATAAGTCPFIYSPSIDSGDGVWTDQGFLAVENTNAPVLGGDTLSTFHSRPFMTASGTAYWVAGYNDGTGSTSTTGRVLYSSSDRTPGSIDVVVRGESTVDGFPIAPAGIDFDYHISDNDNHHIHLLLLDTGSTADDGALVVNGEIVAREAFSVGSPVAGGESWDNFDYMSINNDGVYVFSGDTDGATATDEFIALGGDVPELGGGGPEIVVREGDVVAGFTLSGTMNGLSINNGGFVAWSLDTTDPVADEVIFVGEATSLGSSIDVLRVGDELDINNDATADYVVTDFVGTSFNQVGLSLADDGNLYLVVDVEPAGGGPEVEAVINIDVSDIIPVELVAFEGSADGNSAVLSWETASETNNAGFEVQMAQDGDNYATLGFVAGHGTTTEAQSYSYRVDNLSVGLYTFRLKQIDYDGAFEYSGEVEVDIGVPGQFQLSEVYPNPFNPTTQFTLALAESQDVRLAVYDVLGRRVALLHDGPLAGDSVHEFTLDAAGLASGAYVLRAESQAFTATRSITLLK